MPLKKTSILTKISLMLGILGVVSFAILATFFYWRISTVLSEAIKKEHATFATQLMHNLDQHFYHIGREFSNISQDFALSSYLLNPSSELKQEITDKLSTYSYTSGPWDTLLLLDKEGNMLLNGGNFHEPLEKHSMEAEVTLLTRLTVSDFVISEHTGKPTLVYAVPIYHKTLNSKTIVGYLLGEYSWIVIEEDLAYLDVPVYLINSSGELLTYSDASREKKFDYLQSFAKGLDSVINSPLEVGFNEVTSVFSSSNAIVLRTFVRQKGMLSFKGHNWILILESPLDTVLAPARYTALTMVAILAISTGFLLIFFNAFLSVLVLRPIKSLDDVSRKIIEGDYDTRIKDTDRGDELGSLARVINLMLDKLVTALSVANKQSLDLLKFAQVIKNSTEGVIIADADQKIVFMNKATQALTGLKLANVLHGYAPSVFLHASNDPKLMTDLQDTLNSGKAFISEDIIFNKVGIPDGVEVHLSIYPVIENDKVIFFSGLCRDISERKRIDKAKSEFVSLASHQLRTPLTTIRWYIESLLEGKGGVEYPSENQRAYLDTVLDSNYRMIDLVSSLLNVSRIELGNFSINPEQTDIIVLAKDVLNENVLVAQNKALEIVENYQKDLGELNIDPNLMLIVLQNLITNAVKYTPYKGKITISIAMDDSNANLLLSVKDTGYGIPISQKDKIFTKLFRADNIKMYDTTGTGLGLYISKSIVEQSGGNIWFKSKENEGSEFFVKLPIQGVLSREGEKGLVVSRPYIK